MSSRSADVRIARPAPPSSELGLLQRGRGEGFLGALAMPRARARELVWHCIVNDPRWDLQVESRSTYYASLAVEVDLDPSELNPSRLPAAAQDPDHRLVVKVLSDLYAFGVERAGEVLLDHIASGDEYDDAIHATSQSEALLRQLPEVLDTRFDEAGRVDIVRRWRREVPWSELAQEHRWIAETLAQPQGLRAASGSHPNPRRWTPPQPTFSHIHGAGRHRSGWFIDSRPCFARASETTSSAHWSPGLAAGSRFKR